MIYAVKSVENSEVNKIYADWVSCKDLVWGKSAVYKSFPYSGSVVKTKI